MKPLVEAQAKKTTESIGAMAAGTIQKSVVKPIDASFEQAQSAVMRGNRILSQMKMGSEDFTKLQSQIDEMGSLRSTMRRGGDESERGTAATTWTKNKKSYYEQLAAWDKKYTKGITESNKDMI
jgi:hypothetical protein